MDVTPALLIREKCLQDGQLVRFFGRALRLDDTVQDELRIEDLLQVGSSVQISLTEGSSLPETAAIVRITGSWHSDGTIEAYETEIVEDSETLGYLRNPELLRLLETQSRSAYKIARSRLRASY